MLPQRGTPAPLNMTLLGTFPPLLPPLEPASWSPPLPLPDELDPDEDEEDEEDEEEDEELLPPLDPASSIAKPVPELLPHPPRAADAATTEKAAANTEK